MFTWQNSCNSINLSSLLLLQYILTLYHTTVEQGIHWSLSAPASVIPLLVLAWHKALTSHPVCPLGLPGSSGPLHTGETLVSPASSAGLNPCLQASSLFRLAMNPRLTARIRTAASSSVAPPTATPVIVYLLMALSDSPISSLSSVNSEQIVSHFYCVPKDEVCPTQHEVCSKQ